MRHHLLCALTPLTILAAAPTLARSLQDLSPRQPLSVARPEMPESIPPRLPLDLDAPAKRGRLVLKFIDQVQARLEGERLISRSGQDLEEVRLLLETYRANLSSILGLGEAQAQELQAEAAQRSGRAQPDLCGMYEIRGVDLTLRQLVELGQGLHGLPGVEFVQLDREIYTLPEDYPPMTDLLVPSPDHFGPDPGMDMDYAWSIGARGNGVRITDIEQGWILDHEDLVDVPVVPESGQTPAPEELVSIQSSIDAAYLHGTSVVGFLVAAENDYGVTGIVPDTEVAAFPAYSSESGHRIAQALVQAAIESEPGDVILLEQQTDCPCTPLIAMAPAEVIASNWIATRFAVDYGRIVVSAAGNGDQDLDGSDYAEYRSWGNSGAILVGAGTPDLNHDRYDLSYGSSYGSRVDMQGWGASVTTLGQGVGAYANFNFGLDLLQTYTSNFTGTSSASPFIAGACASLQGEVLARGHDPLSAAEMLTLLSSTGIPQGTNVMGNIGPFPDMRAAHEALCPDPSTICDGNLNSTGSSAYLLHTGSTSVAANDLQLTVTGGPPSQTGAFFMAPQQGSSPYGNGTLCIGGSVLRLPFVSTDGLGEATLAVDLGAAPATAITVGSTWYFQYVYADAAAGPSLNTSSALVVSFCQ